MSKIEKMQNQIDTMELTIKNNNLYYLGDKLINSTMNKILDMFMNSFTVECIENNFGIPKSNLCNSIFIIYGIGYDDNQKYSNTIDRIGNINAVERPIIIDSCNRNDINYIYEKNIDDYKNYYLNKYEKILKNILLHIKNNLSINNQYRPKANVDTFINDEIDKLNNVLYNYKLNTKIKNIDNSKFYCSCKHLFKDGTHTNKCVEKKNKLYEFILYQNTTMQNFIDEITELYK